MADVLTERQKQILLKADEICNGLTPAALNYVTIHDAVMKMAEYVESLPVKSPWVNADKQKPSLDRDCEDEWVSVTVLVRMDSGYRATAYYDFENKTWRDAGSGGRINNPECWATIPE